MPSSIALSMSSRRAGLCMRSRPLATILPIAASEPEATPCTSLNLPLCSSGSTFAHSLRFSARARFRKTQRSIAMARPMAMMVMLK